MLRLCISAFVHFSLLFCILQHLLVFVKPFWHLDLSCFIHLTYLNLPNSNLLLLTAAMWHFPPKQRSWKIERGGVGKKNRQTESNSRNCTSFSISDFVFCCCQVLYLIGAWQSSQILTTWPENNRYPPTHNLIISVKNCGKEVVKDRKAQWGRLHVWYYIN